MKIEINNTNRMGISLAPSSTSARSGSVRNYFKNLRAAEMAAWNLSGGDYLHSEAATENCLGLLGFQPVNALC